MILLLDNEARLFDLPGETREPTARRADIALPIAPAVVPEPATWAGEQGHGQTLEELLSGSWDALASGTEPAACPVCDGALVRRWSAGAGVVGGRCGDCGSELS